MRLLCVSGTPRIEELAVQGEQSSDTGKTKVVAMAVDEEEKEPIWMRKPEKSTKDEYVLSCARCFLLPLL